MVNEYIIVLITTPNQETGEMIANTLLEKKLAAGKGISIVMKRCS
jgi:uncharacterized protein involved in tolerance to divalent cations